MNQRETEIPRRADYGRGVYRRRIELFTGGRSAYGELEDDFHHFRASLRHDRERVIEVQGEGVRVPWTTCGSAIEPLEALVGQPLSGSLVTVMRYCDMKLQCTHLFDAALLALTNVARFVESGASESETHRYDIAVPDRVNGATAPTLHRDGELLLSWQVEGNAIVAPEPYAGRSLTDAGFNLFADHKLDPALGEAALVLRRACFISMGRRWDFERIERAETFGQVVGSACHTFHKDRIAGARHVDGTVRDFTKCETAGGQE